MECGIFLFLIAIIIGFIAIGYAPDLLLRGLQALTSSISDGGAFAGGCIAGSLSTLLLFLLSDTFVAAYDCIFIILILISGLTAGIIGGSVWALIMDRNVRTGASYGAVGGTIAAPLSFFLFIFLAMLFFGG